MAEIIQKMMTHQAPAGFSQNESAMSYSPQLAEIHVAGYAQFAEAAARHVLAEWSGAPGFAFDLGCGGGDTSLALANAGWQVGGVDLSPEMVAMAQRRIPSGSFSVGSVYDCDLPECDVITAIGEVLCYDFEGGHTLARLSGMFDRVFASLRPSGLFLFDLMLASEELDRSKSAFQDGDEWCVGLNVAEDKERGILERHITSFRRSSAAWTKVQETHRLILFAQAEIEAELKRAGFSVTTGEAYDDFAPGGGRMIFTCRR